METSPAFHHRAFRIVLVSVFIASFFAANPPQPVSAGTITVTSTNDSGAGSLRQAVLDASSGDSIEFDPSLAGATITLSSSITLNKNLTIDGSGLDAHIRISGDDSVQVFTVSTGMTVVLDHLDITNGSATSGGGIFSDGVLTINHSNLYDNSAVGSGGAVFSNNGGLTIAFSSFSNNSSGSLGGAIQNYGTATITNTTFAENDATNDGGGVYTGVDTLTISNSTFAGNSAGRWGGGIYNSNATTLNLKNTIIADSPSGGDCHNNGTIGTNTNNLIEDGSCSPDFSGDPQLGSLELNGGGTRTVSLGSSSTAIDFGDDATCESTDQRGVQRPQGGHCDIGAYEAPPQDVVNSLGDPGDGNCNASECTLREAVAAVSSGTSVTFDGSLAGGTISLSSEVYVDKSLTLDGSSLSTPIKVSGGGSVRVFHTNSASRAYIENIEIIDGDASAGGGIYNTGLLTISESTISGNSATSNGGGILNQGSLTLQESTLFSNSAFTGSGIDSDGVLEVENSTIVNNINNSGEAWVSNSTITSLNNDDVLYMENSLLSDCVSTGFFLTNNHNMVESGACSPYKSGNAFLGSLADNGGPTHTRAIPGYSPAVNSGDDATCESTDQRGVTRPQWLHCDIGAYEYEPTLALTVNSSAEPGDGTCDETECTLREALNAIDVGGVITFEPGLAGETIAVDDPGFGITGNVTIDGSGLNPHIQISGSDLTGVFHVYSSASDVVLRHLDILESGDNSAAVINQGTLSVENCSLFDNNISAEGAILNDGGTLDVSNSTFTNNSASYGGGIYNYSGEATIRNSTIHGNDATIKGGGIYNNNATTTVLNSTVSGNDAASGGGIFNEFGEVHLSNTIVANSGSGGDCSSYNGLSTNTHNLIEDGSCSPYLSGDPLLGPLADNGGPTQTMALLAGSPAIDAGDDGTCESTDQRGVSRPQGAHCDIGAFEAETAPEMDVQGSSTSIADGDSTPSASDDTDFGSTEVSGGTVAHTFTIENTGTAALNLTGVPKVEISGTHAGDFSVTSTPTSPVASSGGTTTFEITFDPSAAGVRTAGVSIDNNDTDENPYNFSIQGEGTETILALTVNSDADPGDGTCDVSECTLREAVDAISPGGVITFDSIVDGTTINLGAEIAITKDLTIDATDLHDGVVLSGGGSVRAFSVSGGAAVEIIHFTIVDGSSIAGSGIANEGGSTLTISDCRMESNSADDGGAINNNNADLNITACTFASNFATDYGGAINNLEGTVTIRDSTFTGNITDQYGGALFNNDGDVTLFNSTLEGNSAVGGGGILNYLGDLTLTNSTLYGNSADPDSGGGIANAPASSIYLRNTIIAGSPSGGDCANSGTLAVNISNLIEDGSCSPWLAGSPNLGPLANNGGPTETMALLAVSDAIDAADDGTCESTDQRGVARPQGAHCDIGAFEYPSLLEVNSTADPGDGICNTSQCTLREAVTIAASGDTVTFNPDLDGAVIDLGAEIVIAKDLTIDATDLHDGVVLSGGHSVHAFLVSNASTVELDHLKFVDGFADTGGAIWNDYGSNLTVSACVFEGNHAVAGGAINNSGSTLTVHDSTFFDNSAEVGGAINIYGGTAEIDRSTFHENSSDTHGGAIFNDAATLTVTNSTFYLNDAQQYSGGIANYLGTLTLSNSTLSDNSAVLGGGGISNGPSGSTLHLLNTIIAGSPSGGDCVNSGTIATNDSNLIEDGSCSSYLTGDPILDSLADNGGLTETMALLPGSPAIDAADDATCAATDQRGVPRPKGLHCDIGAFELELPYSVFLPLIMR